jgi:hypothetical protein
MAGFATGPSFAGHADRGVPNAAECIQLAEAARTSQHKSFFIEIAERWHTPAEYAQRRIGSLSVD